MHGMDFNFSEEQRQFGDALRRWAQNEYRFEYENGLGEASAVHGTFQDASPEMLVRVEGQHVERFVEEDHGRSQVRRADGAARRCQLSPYMRPCRVD